MSYIRSGSVLRYVEGESKDYIYATYKVIRKNEPVGRRIEDFGNINNETLVEFVSKMINEDWRKNDEEFVEYIIKNLAEKLNVKLRKKPLSYEEEVRISQELHDKWIAKNKLKK